MNKIEWSNDAGDGDRTEDPTVIAHLEAQGMSVGEAYRSLHFFPDFLVLWQIGRRRVAVFLAVIDAGSLLTIAGAALTQNGVAIGFGLFLAAVALLASLFVFFSLENWVIEYNASVDSELRRVLGR